MSRLIEFFVIASACCLVSAGGGSTEQCDQLTKLAASDLVHCVKKIEDVSKISDASSVGDRLLIERSYRESAAFCFQAFYISKMASIPSGAGRRQSMGVLQRIIDTHCRVLASNDKLCTSIATTSRSAVVVLEASSCRDFCRDSASRLKSLSRAIGESMKAYPPADEVSLDSVAINAMYEARNLVND